MATKMIGNTEVEIKYVYNHQTGEKTEFSLFDYWVLNEKNKPVDMGFVPTNTESLTNNIK